jgi:adenosylcobalamin-dependent ribonucleoside-triphosphate reductase
VTTSIAQSTQTEDLPHYHDHDAHTPIKLSPDFIDKYEQKESPLSPMGTFVFYRTYSRFSNQLGRRETWLEACKRAVEYNVGLAYSHMVKIGYIPDLAALNKEAEYLFDSMYNTKQFVSGRTLWIGGGENHVADKYPLANYNCSFTAIEKWSDLADLFYLLLVGTGVGFKCTPEMAEQLPPIRANIEVLHDDYIPAPPEKRLEHTKWIDLEQGYAKIYIGDSKEGWVEALRLFLEILTTHEYEHIKTVKFDYNSVRPRGEKLKTFGGTASGPEPLREMFEGFHQVLTNQIDPSLAPLQRAYQGYYKVRPIHILDIGNLIGNNVVVGGVRRTAEIFLMGDNDYEALLAKYAINGLWTDEQFKAHRRLGNRLEEIGEKPEWWDSIKLEKGQNSREGLDHRRMSNNSIVFSTQPDKKYLDMVFDMMRYEGEPGFFNEEEASRRRPNAVGTNPCGEILLDTHGVCNLTTVNMSAFVQDGDLDVEGLLEAQKMSARAGLRMTLVDLELPSWNDVQQRDRLLGTSLTGVKDAFSAVSYNKRKQNSILQLLRETANKEAVRYAAELRVNSPLLVTTVKPEGTLSLVAGGVSAGIHMSHSPYYIRRMRISSIDPLVQVIQDLDWPISPEVGTPGDNFEEQMNNARTLVIDFPVKSSSTDTKNDVSLADQMDTYFQFQDNYTDHNTSITMTVKENEWDLAKELAWENWDKWMGASFLSHDGGTYELAPYEEITEEEYNNISAGFKEFDPSLLSKYEKVEIETELMDEACESGACPIR